STLIPEEIERVEKRFTRPQYEELESDAVLPPLPGFDAWAKRNVHPHKVPGYAAVTLSLKKTGVPPGDVTADQMDAIAGLGHRHVGHVGILGVDKNGEEWYQVEIGGNQAPGALGKVIGPAFARADVPDVIERLIETYLEQRDSEAERFVDVVQRVGIEPFKERVYGNAHQRAPDRDRERALA